MTPESIADRAPELPLPVEADVAEGGAKVLLRTTAVGAWKQEGGWRLAVETNAGRREIDCKRVVDATGECLLARLVGSERLPTGEPATLRARQAVEGVSAVGGGEDLRSHSG